MIVDDESVIRKGISCLIDWNALGCTVVFQAANGREAQRYLAASPVDIVVSDIRMPDMDGLQLAQFIHETLPSTKVILLTAFADFSYAQAAIRYNVVDYVIKTRYVEKLPEAVVKARDMLQQHKEQEDTIRGLQDTLQADAEVKCETFLKDVMNGLLIDRETMQKKACEHSVLLHHYRVMAFELSDAQEGTPETSPEEQNQFSRSIRNFLALALKDYRHFILCMGKSTLVAVVSFSDGHAGASLNALLLTGNEILAVADGFLKFTVSIGISEVHHTVGDLPVAWLQARDALSGIFYGDSRVSVYLRQTEQQRATVQNPAYRLIDGIVDALRQGDSEKAVCGLEDLLQSYRVHQTAIEQVKTTGMLLCSACCRLLSSCRQEESAQEEYAQEDGELETYRRIQDSKSLHRLSDVPRDRIRRTAETLRTCRKPEHPLVREIGLFIRANYNKPINLQKMAEHVHVNGSYLSSLYKKQTGEALIDALNRYRIDRAKQLLKEPGKKVLEVAQAVGIEDPAYFTHVFARYAGVSPKEYRMNGDSSR